MSPPSDLRHSHPQHGAAAAAAPDRTDRATVKRCRAVAAMVGNPNTGKTSLFNALTGFRRHVANYPGVTVDVARGPLRGAAGSIELLDLPGTYSLTATSPDEMVVCNALGGRIAGHAAPDVVLAVVDAANLVRNLYLLSQVLELDLPVVVALNMVDLAAARGIEIDAALLAQRLGVPVVPVIATDEQSSGPLVAALESALVAPQARRDVSAAAHVRTAAAGADAETAAVRARYQWVNQVLEGVVERKLRPGHTWSDRLDRVLTQRITGSLALALILYALFFALYRGAEPLRAGIEWVFRSLGHATAAALPAGVLRSLVHDGLFGGVGGVLAFLPQIALLFLFIAILEDCGYMARAAFMVDRLMRPLGLSGRAFIPLLTSFACAVPAIMGTRAIADRRERFITILIAPFMSCSARLPVYVLMIGAFVPHKAWLGSWVRLDALVMLAMYLVGVAFAIPIAWVLKRTAFAGPAAGFLLELPTYKWPRVRTVVQRVYLASRSFVVRAGTVILLVNLAVWALGYFPRSTATRQAVEAQRAAEGWDDATTDKALAGAYLRDSYLGRLGHAVEPAIAPLGWDWRIGIGVLASFPARELIIATLSTVANLGQGESDSMSLQDAFRQMRRADTGAPLFTLPVALSIMVFFALCAQCVSTLTVIGRETGSWRWPVASFVGMTTLAYGAALGVSWGARALGL